MSGLSVLFIGMHSPDSSGGIRDLSASQLCFHRRGEILHGPVGPEERIFPCSKACNWVHCVSAFRACHVDVWYSFGWEARGEEVVILFTKLIHFTHFLPFKSCIRRHSLVRGYVAFTQVNAQLPVSRLLPPFTEPLGSVPTSLMGSSLEFCGLRGSNIPRDRSVRYTRQMSLLKR